MCRYVDGIISTMHPAYSDDGSTVLQRSSGKECPHPAKKLPLEIEDAHQDLVDCVAAMQIHVCRPNSCLKSVAGKNCQSCRFRFPKPLVAHTDIIRDEETDEVEVVTKRNHGFVNNYNKLGLQAWRANSDAQMVTSSQKLKRYSTKLMKYSTKAEPASKQVQSVFDAVAQNSTNKEAKVVNAVLMNAVGGRDYGAQEVCTLLSGEPLVTTSREFVTISMDQRREVKKRFTPGEVLTVANIIDQYKLRPDQYEEISLFDYASIYTIKKNRPETLLPRSKKAIVMHYPFLPNNPTSPQYETYCRIQMMLHLPFRMETSLKEEEESWAEAYRRSPIFELHKQIDLRDASASEDSDRGAAEGGPAPVTPRWALLCDGPQAEVSDYKYISSSCWNITCK